MKKTIFILLAMMLLLTACGKKAEEPSEPTPSESETMPTESEPIPSESESDTEDATEMEDYFEMYDESDVIYAKELTSVRRVENPIYKIEGYYSTPSEAFAGHPIVHGYENLDSKPWNLDTHSYCADMVVSIPLSGEFFPDDFIKDYSIDKNGVPYRTDEERKYVKYLSTDSIVFKEEFKIPSAFALETDEKVGILAELLATTDGERIKGIDYYITKVFAYGKLIDISDFVSGISYLMNAGRVFYFQGDSVYFVVNGVNSGRLKITEDEVSFTEGYWGYFYDEIGMQTSVYDEYGQKISWGFHAGKKFDDIYPLGQKPVDKITLPYWD